MFRSVLYLQITCISVFLNMGCSRPEVLGGSMTAQLTNNTSGTHGTLSVKIKVVTGWMLGTGPCGKNCSAIDVGTSTNNRRTLIESLNNDQFYFGDFTVEYKNHTIVVVSDITNAVKSSYSETVVAVSLAEYWEQTELVFNASLTSPGQEEDIAFQEHYWYGDWHNERLLWRMQIKLNNNQRNDTASFNRPPRVVAKPYYRIELDRITTITIAVVDEDDDFILCRLSRLVETPIRTPVGISGIYLNRSCQITFEAYSRNNFTSNMVFPVAISVKDFVRRPIQFGEEVYYNDDSLTLSTIPVQFTVRVVSTLTTPTFVYPSHGPNHQFIIYAGASWEADIFVKSTLRPLDALQVICDNGNCSAGSVHRDPFRTDVYFANLTWSPTGREEKKAIVCIKVIDRQMLESAEFLCFLLDQKDYNFTFSQHRSNNQPYFVDVPSPTESIQCPLNATCIVPVNIASNRAIIRDVKIYNSSANFAHATPIASSFVVGQRLYHSNIHIRHAFAEEIQICLTASDNARGETDLLCFHMDIILPDPCFQQPCQNSGICTSQTETGIFTCTCSYGYTGKFCETELHIDPCTNNPCGDHGLCLNSVKPYFCYCSDDYVNPNDYTGINCTEKIDDCKSNPCQNGGICMDGILSYSCNCGSRFTGIKCDTDLCPASQSNTSCTYDSKCNFDNDTYCMWHNVHAGDNFDWILHQGETPSDNTGPLSDHTTGTSQGRYYYIETSAPRQAYETAWLQSEYLASSNGEIHCLEFWYNMFGTSVGYLHVILSDNATVPGYNIWSIEGNQGPKWNFAQVTVTTNGLFRIIFEGTVGDGYEGDIALDDISLKEGNCSVARMMTSVASTIVTSTVPTTSPMPVLIGQGCYGDPCVRGVCYVHFDDYFCLCPSGFKGKNCEIHI